MEYRFLELLDVVILRGNKLFGAAGSYGECMMPPWPSAVAGALRSRMLVDEGYDLALYAAGHVDHPVLGTPAQPGSFTVCAFHVARRFEDGHVEVVMNPPADVVVRKRGEDGEVEVGSIRPRKLEAGQGKVGYSYGLPLLPVLVEKERSKPASGYWMRESGLKKYLRCEPLTGEDFIESKELWALESRVGVALEPETRSVREGALFTTEVVVPWKRYLGDGRSGERQQRYECGFLVGVTGAMPPSDGLVRLGGDGRAARVHAVQYQMPEPDYKRIASARRCRIVLATPAVFEQGWVPNGASADGSGAYRLDLCGVKGRIVAACVPRGQVVSGWDLARDVPKPALRAAPAGSVYWVDQLEATVESLRGLMKRGLWSEPCEDEHRRAEGFNRIFVAEWRDSGKES